MIDQYTYELLKRIHEFPWGKDGKELEYNSFMAKYRAIYGDINQIRDILSRLKSLGFLDIPKNNTEVQIFITDQSYVAVQEYENTMDRNYQRYLFEEENIKLQNQQFHYQNELRSKENEIRDLTLVNLKLQNKQLKNKIIYFIIGAAITFVLTNWKEILIMLKIIEKQ